MRFYTKPHQFYCGIDLHARTMYVCILNQEWRDSACTVICKTTPETVSEGHCALSGGSRRRRRMHVHLVLAGRPLCSRRHPFVLGHALYMKAIHGGKAKNDKIDAQKIAVLLRGGMLPAGLRLSGRDAGHPRPAPAPDASDAQTGGAAGPYPEYQEPV